MARHQHGFSLLEMAIVLAIMGFLLASLIIPLSTQMENARLKENRETMKQIRAAIEGFFIANRRFPCPASSSSKGVENFNTGFNSIEGGQCRPSEHGFLPAVTLGLSGTYNADGYLLDPWGHPYLYSVNAIRDEADGSTGCNSDSKPDLTSKNQLYTAVKHGCAKADFDICSDSGCSRKLATNIPVVILSLGKNWASTMTAPTSDNETNNANDTVVFPTSSGLTYYTHLGVTNPNIFIAADYTPSNDASRFDDVIEWISLPVLYNKMVEAGIYNNN